MSYSTFFYLIFMVSLIFFQSSCSYFQEREEPEVVSQVIKEKPITFSENPNIGVFNSKMYKRRTRQSLEDESEVHAKAGSFWTTEGQSGFLFTQNTSRREGDGVTVKLEGAARDQILTKVDVIKKLLARLDAPPPPPPVENAEEPQRGLASEPNAGQTTPGVPSKAEAKKTTASATPQAVSKAPSELTQAEDEPFKVETIPSKIIERLADGNYRIKGAQTFMIGKREYKVIVTGLIRADDFNDEGVNAGKIVDSQFDVVSVRRSQIQ